MLSRKTVGLALFFTFYAQITIAQWAWRESGGTVYSDKPPPSSVPLSDILRQPAVQAQPAASTPTVPVAPAVPSAGASKLTKPETKSTAELDAEFRERRAQKAEEDKKNAEAAQKKQQLAEECERSRDYLKSLKDGVRVRTGKDNAIMEDAQREKEIQRVQQQVSRACQ